MQNVQLCSLVNHSDPDSILEEVKKIFSYHYPEHSFLPVEIAFGIIKRLFSGNYPGYSACNTEYHDLSHTLDAFLASSRLLDGKNLSSAPYSPFLALRLLQATLFHDTGYIQESTDYSGTGAKYTANHVERSIEFVQKNAVNFALSKEDVQVISVLISCTGLKSQWDDFSFSNDDEHTAGAMLASADLLGQMSDRAYLEKLLFLYYEFREAGIPGFNTEFDILRKTLDFYIATRDRLDTTLLSSYQYAQIHFAKRCNADSNLYIIAIERQMDYLREIIADESTNFRQKLKRLDLSAAESRYISQ